MPERSRISFGSAQLLGPRADPADGLAVLEAAVTGGAERLDTAPSYGAGACEGLVADVLRDHPHVAVTTKVGLDPKPHPPAWRVLAGGAVARMPDAVASALRRARRGDPPDDGARSQRFVPASVRSSVERSLALFDAPVDRLLLHEVHPADVDEELLDVLRDLVLQGSVRQTGCATQNHLTPEVLRRGAGVLTVAHVSAAPLSPAPPPTPEGTTVVHHGLLGATGADLRSIAAFAEGDDPTAVAWRETASTHGFRGVRGVADALLRRGSTRGADEVIVATSRPDRAAEVVGTATAGPLPPSLAEALERLLAAVGRRAAP